MSSASVFNTLQELFPQVDHRMLRALAIEHTKDVDAAVEFILNEVLPSFCSPAEEPNILIDENDDKHISMTTCSEVAHSPHDLQDVRDESSGQREQMQFPQHHYAAEEANEGAAVSRFIPSEGNTGNFPDKQNVNIEAEELSSPGTYKENVFIGPIQGSHDVSSSSMHDAHVFNVARVVLNDLNEPSADDANLSASGDSFNGTNLNEMGNVVAQIDSTYLSEETQEHVEYVSQIESSCFSDSSISIDTISDQMLHDTKLDEDEEAKLDDVEDGKLDDVEDESFSSTVVTQSGQVCKIDVLEDAISDAKNNKRTLFSSMESVINMMREAEDLEKAAERAKEEAVRGGLGIFAKVEDIKKMLLHAKEANDMHTGEVYGEKSILATEARELQSRLLNLSYERDNSLAILNEMRQTLEARLIAAEEVRKAAEQDKLEKEESARKALAEQELIMEKVVQESKRLQKEAGENSKLREFLMDRGQVVDMLQGEIAVICKDVKLLKENFDDQVPFSKSLSSSQTSCILASSGSSSGKSLATSLLAEQVESESPKMTGTTPLESSSEKSTSEWTEGIVHKKQLMDDDWDFFEDEAGIYSSQC